MMGQYYLLANLDRREFVHAHKIKGGLKAWEWAANVAQAGPIVLLLGWSNSAGGGDPDWDHPDIKPIAGRWAGDRVALVGDYYEPDERGLPTYDEISENFTEISDLLIPAWNKFIEIPKYKIGEGPQDICPDFVITPNGPVREPKILGR